MKADFFINLRDVSCDISSGETTYIKNIYRAAMSTACTGGSNIFIDRFFVFSSIRYHSANKILNRPAWTEVIKNDTWKTLLLDGFHFNGEYNGSKSKLVNIGWDSRPIYGLPKYELEYVTKYSPEELDKLIKYYENYVYDPKI